MGDQPRSAAWCFMPQDIEKFPRTFVLTTKVVRSLVLRSTRRLNLRRAALGPPKRRGGFLLFLDKLLAPFADEEIFARFLVEPRDIVVANGAGHYAPHGLGAEIVFRVEAVHPFDQLAAIESGINGIGELMPARVGHALDRHQAVGFGVLVELGP